MNIAIVDDKDTDLKNLSNLVEECTGDMGIAGNISLFRSGDELLDDMKESVFDIIFLDIYMNGKDGMETAHKVRESDRQVHIVFVTITDAFSIEGYDVGATNYLVKPIDKAMVKNAIKSCFNKQMLDSRYITFSSRDQEYTILLKNIIFAQKSGNRINLHTEFGVIKIYMPMSEFAPLVLGDARFLRVYYGGIVNLSHVRKIDNNQFIMDEGSTIPMRKKSKPSLIAAWHSFEAKSLGGGSI